MWGTPPQRRPPPHRAGLLLLRLHGYAVLADVAGLDRVAELAAVVRVGEDVHAVRLLALLASHGRLRASVAARTAAAAGLARAEVESDDALAVGVRLGRERDRRR